MEAVRLAEDFLPSTDQIHGRKSKPRSHYWFRASEQAFETDKFTDEEGEMLLVEAMGTRRLSRQACMKAARRSFGSPRAKSPLIPPRNSLRRAVDWRPPYWSCETILGKARDTASPSLLPAISATADLPKETQSTSYERSPRRPATKKPPLVLANVRSTWERRRNGEAIKGRGEFKKLLGKNADRTLSLLDRYLDVRHVKSALPAPSLDRLEALLEAAAAEPEKSNRELARRQRPPGLARRDLTKGCRFVRGFLSSG